MSDSQTQKLYRIVKDQPITLLSGGFHGFPKLNADSVQFALKQYPEFAEYLPNSRSVPVAFTKLKNDIRDLKVDGKTMVVIPSKPEDMTSWTWTTESLVDGFSINVASAITEGHDTAPDGCIGLSKDLSLVVSPTASMFLISQSIDIQDKFQNIVAECGADEMRKAFNRFVQSLGTKSIKLKGGAILVLPTGQERTQEYLKALRIAGVSDEFVATWNVMLDEGNFVQLKNSIKLQTQSYLKDLGGKLELANARKNTLQQESTTILEIVSILDDYGIDDGILGQLTSVDAMIKEQIAKHTNKVPTPRKKANDGKRQKQLEKIACSNCFATLVYKQDGQAVDMSASSASYDFSQHKLELVDASSGKLQTISLADLTQILLCSVTPISATTIVHTTYTIDPSTSMVAISKRSKTMGGKATTPSGQSENLDVADFDDELDDELDDAANTEPENIIVETLNPTPIVSTSTQIHHPILDVVAETVQVQPSQNAIDTQELDTKLVALLDWIRETIESNRLPRLLTAQDKFSDELVDYAIRSRKVLLDSNSLSIVGE